MDGDTPHLWLGQVGAIGLMLCLAVAALSVAGCSSKSGSSNASASSTTAETVTSSTYPSGKEAVCQARDQLKTSVTALTKPALLTGGSAAIKAAVDQVQTDLDALKAAAKTDYQPQVDAVQASVKQLQTDAGNLGNGSVAQNLTTVGTDIAAVGTTSTDLFTLLKTSCGS
ncbi:MAG: hypothetical protein ACXWCB_17415 [Acidimicrobiales bacterium]